MTSISATHRYAYIITYRNQKNPEICSLFFVLCYLFIEKRPTGRFFTVHLQFAVRALEHHQSLYVPVPLCRGDAL